MTTSRVSVTVFDDEPGGGKTRYALKQIVSNGPGVYWWAINKISPLATERFTELMTYAEQAGVTIDFLPIHSEASGRGTMKMRIDKRMKEINDHPLKNETIFVTIITHKTLIDHYLSNVTGILLIDEPVQIWEQRHFEFPASYRTIRQLIVPENVHDAYDGDLNANIDADTQAIRFRLTEEGRDELNDEAKKRDTDVLAARTGYWNRRTRPAVACLPWRNSGTISMTRTRVASWTCWRCCIRDTLRTSIAVS